VTSSGLKNAIGAHTAEGHLEGPVGTFDNRSAAVAPDNTLPICIGSIDIMILALSSWHP
jgi:hypothetical protein